MLPRDARRGHIASRGTSRYLHRATLSASEAPVSRRAGFDLARSLYCEPERLASELLAECERRPGVSRPQRARRSPQIPKAYVPGRVYYK